MYVALLVMTYSPQQHLSRNYPIRKDEERSFEKIIGQSSVAFEYFC